jgi:hypothetical protein
MPAATPGSLLESVRERACACHTARQGLAATNVPQHIHCMYLLNAVDCWMRIASESGEAADCVVSMTASAAGRLHLHTYLPPMVPLLADSMQRRQQIVNL